MVDEIRRRVQKEATGKRGVKEDPLYRSRRLLLQGAEHLKKKQRDLLTELLEAGDKDGEVTIAWNAYQELRLIYYVPHADGPGQVQALLNKFGDCPIPEVKRLCKTLKKWQTEICAYFATKGASNGPTEAINGVIETTRRVARGLTQLRELPHPLTALRRRPPTLPGLGGPHHARIRRAPLPAPRPAIGSALCR